MVVMNVAIQVLLCCVLSFMAPNLLVSILESNFTHNIEMGIGLGNVICVL